MQTEDKEKEIKKQAIALSYDEEKGDIAPKVVAIGKGTIAEKIIAKAKEAGVPLQKDPDLVTSLCQIELGRPIPPELYEAVARLLAFVLFLDGEVAARENKLKEKILSLGEINQGQNVSQGQNGIEQIK